MKLLQPIVLFVLCLSFPPAPAQADLNAELLSGNIPAEKLDQLIAENARNPALVFDLLELKAQKTPQPAVMAELAVLRAALAARYGDQIQADLPELHLDAADLLLQAGLADPALKQLYAALDALRARAANPDRLVHLLRRIADLEETLGNPDKAARLRQSAENVPPSQDEPFETRSDDAGFVRVEVFYATDRAQTGKTRPVRFYGSDRAQALEYGQLEVTIPRVHVPGAVEAPSIWRLEFSPDPAKHVMLQSVTPVERDAFFASMNTRLEDSGADDAFVFVHGYNVSFDAAAKRAAQLAYDMKFKGVPVLYSWPSKGATVGYIPDTAVVRLSGRRLTRFLEEMAERSGARTIHLIGHSMGNRALTDALELMALRRAPIAEPVFDQVIFAAPDVDMGLFAEMLPTIRPLARRLTLYASDQDWALEASRKLHGNLPRAGQGGDQALIHDHIDTIDMSELGDDMLAHSYVANDQSALLDISMLFWRDLDPQNRCGLAPKDATQPRPVWQYRKGICPDLDLLTLVGSLRNAGAVSSDQVRSTLRRNFADEPQVRALETMLLDITSDKK